MSHGFWKTTEIGQAMVLGLVAVLALAAVIASALSGLGVLGWPQLALSYDGQALPWAGMALQLGVTGILVLLALTIPAAWRVRHLHSSHRRFEIDMDDVTRAYRAAHMADRTEMFQMHREFDAVRERYRYIKTLPELSEMDADLLTMAAQMSAQSSDLAKTFSDEHIARARENLKQRASDAEALEVRLQDAFSEVRALRRMMDDVDVSESTVHAQLQRLRDEVMDLGLAGRTKSANVRSAPLRLSTIAAE